MLHSFEGNKKKHELQASYKLTELNYVKYAAQDTNKAFTTHSTECTHTNTFNTHCMIYALTQFHIT